MEVRDARYSMASYSNIVSVPIILHTLLAPRNLHFKGVMYRRKIKKGKRITENRRNEKVERLIK